MIAAITVVVETLASSDLDIIVNDIPPNITTIKKMVETKMMMNITSKNELGSLQAALESVRGDKFFWFFSLLEHIHAKQTKCRLIQD